MFNRNHKPQVVVRFGLAGSATHGATSPPTHDTTTTGSTLANKATAVHTTVVSRESP